ncbi:MAG TPA: hypothetical protein VJ931_02975 [Actinomycetota bacterium]|nr:hypothetical protein [Actinomycetota bacterium]
MPKPMALALVMAGDERPALGGERAEVPAAATVGPGGRSGYDGPEEATR